MSKLAEIEVRVLPQSVDKRCRRCHGRVERLAMDGPLVSRYLTLSFSLSLVAFLPSFELVNLVQQRNAFRIG